MAEAKNEILAEVVRKHTILYDKSDPFFKDKYKKQLAWADVAKTAGYLDGKILYSVFQKTCLSKIIFLKKILV